MEYSKGKPVRFCASVARTWTEPAGTKGSASSAALSSTAEALYEMHAVSWPPSSSL